MLAALPSVLLMATITSPAPVEGPQEAPAPAEEGMSDVGDETVEEDEKIDAMPWPTLRLDMGGRGSLTAPSPVQFSLRVEGGVEVIWDWYDSGDESRGVVLTTGVGYRYDHAAGPRLVRRDLAEIGVGLGYRRDGVFSVAYRGALVAGTVVGAEGRELGLGLRHGPQLGYSALSMAWFALSVNHEILWRPELEHAIVITASVELLTTVWAILWAVAP